ncbi:aminotransferase class III-fold pyridoxal phosphate-dependent enzyme (plasmid) [Gemmobacter fulvus]|uniref:Aminotransferase class III-fold pyridoxal phosphate-dependent enzyme n=1 Tax=Gemmobacter fulvus TaxID=2840474 RepID=A0A975S2Q4_9RHOB|nr:aminotransferase class III-fold pyridoxal phosphate-dependent enzyme [Gemmobacter fulvus]MBT9246206.1 aminotransferase class III-fold pyridoxal phosphate-dependent enzyme [Gemmobacter fulvus]QWK92434.1 aminotransferase class III-fold pyridoxal phosphate-dependent enzyme [Gemmobacter fulvus]
MRDTNFLTENNARHMWHPMAHPAEMRAHPPRIIAAAQGVEITDIHGKTALDGVGGLWNVNLGYSSAPVKQAIADQLEALPYYSVFRGTANAPQIELSYELAEWFREDGLTRAFFTSGGSDSVETCLRLARQYHKVNGQPERTKFFALKKGYHGTHFGGASVNGNPAFRRNYAPMLDGVFHLPAPYPYRSTLDTENPAAMARIIARQFEDDIAFQGADTIAALIVEPVLGAGGVIVPHPTLLPLLRAICDRHGILMIADEVITAFGRTGAWTGSRLWGVKPDLMATAKAITNGYFPFGAAMISDRIAQAFEANSDTRGLISHGYTYSGHPVGAAAALATLAEAKRLNLAANAAARGAELMAGLHALKSRHAVIGDVRGIGLMCALELVSDPETRTGLGKDKVQTVQDVTYDAGCMVRTSGSNIIFSPPLIITSDHVARMLAALDAGLAAVKA